MTLSQGQEPTINQRSLLIKVGPSVQHYRSLCVIIDQRSLSIKVRPSVRHYQSLCVIIDQRSLLIILCLDYVYTMFILYLYYV